jgi:hypothetical protein
MVSIQNKVVKPSGSMGMLCGMFYVPKFNCEISNMVKKEGIL